MKHNVLQKYGEKIVLAEGGNYKTVFSTWSKNTPWSKTKT